MVLAWGTALYGIDLNRSRRSYSSPAAQRSDGQLLVFWPKAHGLGWCLARTTRMSDWMFVPQSSTLHDVKAWTGFRRVSQVPCGWSAPSMDELSSEILSFGWPWPSLWSQWDATTESFSNIAYLSDLPRTNPPYFRNDRSGNPSANRPLAIPVGITWPLFVASVSAHAGAWWTLLTGWAFAKRTFRRRRGLCARCAYSRAGLDPHAPCPECGTTRKKGRHASSASGSASR